MIPSVPFAGISIYFALGILLTHTLPVLQWNVFVIGPALLCLVLIFIRPFWTASPRAFSFTPLINTGIIALLCMLAGMLCYIASQHHPEKHVLHHIQKNQEIQLLGEIVSPPVSTNQSTRFVFLAHRLYAGNEVFATTGKIQVYINEKSVTVTPGHLVLIKGKLANPSRPRNPGAFNQHQFLKTRGIHAVMYATHLVDFRPPNSISQIFRQQVFQFQQYIRSQLDSNLTSTSSRSVMRALLLGDQSTIAPTIKSAFRETGLTHLLAVSGLHVMLVGFLVYQLLRPLLTRLDLTWYQVEITRAVVTLLLLGIYALITGAKAPVVRAVLMAMLFILGPIFRKPASSINSIGFAAMVLLVYRPQYLFDVGFQLSFSAVLGIIFCLRHFNEIIKPTSKLLTRVAQSIFVSLAATLSTLPILLFHFGYVSFAGLLLNFFALPLTSGALCAGLAMIALGPLSPFFALLAGSAAEILLLVLIALTKEGASVMSSMAITPGKINWTTLAALLSALVLLIGISSGKRIRWRVIISSLAITVTLTWFSLFHSINGRPLSLVFFDVGHGDACLVQFPNGKTLLIDTGNQNQFTNSAERTILPFLASKGIKSIDTILLSHDHQDHTGGLSTLLEQIYVGRVVHAFSASHQARNMQIHSSDQSVLAGDTLLIDPSARIRILSPDNDLINHSNINEHSIVLQIAYGENTFLFLGDAEIEAELFIQKYFPAFLYSDIVKVGHHGSQTSSSQSLIDKISLINSDASVPSRPLTAVISVGSSSGYGLPDETVVSKWRATYAQLHTTHKYGAYWIRSNGKDLWEVSY